MKTLTVEEFVTKKVSPEFRDIVSELRRLIKKQVPDAKEYITYGIPVYKLNKIFVVISPTKQDITLSFSRGAEFEDKYNMLGGVGKVSKYIKFKKIEDIDEIKLHYYLEQAVMFDSK